MSSFNKSIRVFGGVSILTGIIVGSGIFFVGSLVLDVLNYSPGFALLAWLVGGGTHPQLCVDVCPAWGPAP